MPSPNDRISLNARGWYQAARQAKLPRSYIRFICLWEALCAWYRDVLNNTNDKELTKWLEGNLSDWHRARLAEDAYRDRIRCLKDRSPIFKMRGEKKEKPVLITDESDFGQVVTAIYTVRCNLMKGGKAPRENDRDVGVCEAASEVLDAIVKHLTGSKET